MKGLGSLWLVLLAGSAHGQLGFSWLFGFGPEISDQPGAVEVHEFDELVVRPTVHRASGYQWLKLNSSGIWDPIKNEETDTLKRDPALAPDSGHYKLRVFGIFGEVESQMINITVIPSMEQVRIVSNPIGNVLLEPRQVVVLTVDAISSHNLTYTWIMNGNEVTSNSGKDLRLENLPHAGLYFIKCRVCTPSGNCVNSTTTRLTSTNEFGSPFPKYYGPKEVKIVSLKGTRPYPDRDDLNVRCLFRNHDGDGRVESVAYSDQNAYIVYDDESIPTVFCSMGGDEMAPGHYHISVIVQDQPAAIPLQPNVLIVYDDLLLQFKETSLNAAWHSPMFNFAVLGDFREFSIGHEAYGYLLSWSEIEDSDPPKVKCVVDTDRSMSCQSERAVGTNIKLKLSLNGLTYTRVNGRIDVYLFGDENADDHFSSMSPRSGPPEGGTLLEISGNGFQYSGQEMFCIFEDMHSIVSKRVPAEMNVNSISCRAPSWTHEEVVLVKLDIGDAKNVPVVPPFVYVKSPEIESVVPNYLPQLTVASVKPFFRKDLDESTFLSTVLDGVATFFSNPDPGTASQMLKMGFFFVKGKNFRIGMIASIEVTANGRNAAEQRYPGECAVQSQELLLCRIFVRIPVGAMNIHVSFDDFSTFASAPVVIYGIRSLMDMDLHPRSSSLLMEDNVLSLNLPNQPHLFYGNRIPKPQIFLHVDKFTSRALPCDVTDPYSVQCHLPRAARSMEDQLLPLSISVGASSTRYVLKQSLEFFRAPQVVDVNPSILSGYGGQPVVVSLDREIPSGAPLKFRLALSNGEHEECSELRMINPKSFLFTIPTITSVIQTLQIQVILQNEIVAESRDLFVFNTVIDKFEPSALPVHEPATFRIIGHHINKKLTGSTYIRLSDATGNTTYVLNAVSTCRTEIMFEWKGSDVPLVNAKASVTFDNGTTFWRIASPFSLYDPSFESVDLQHLVSPTGDGSSALILRGDSIPSQVTDVAAVRISPIHPVNSNTQSDSPQTYRCIVADKNALMCLFSAPLIENQSIEISLNGIQFHKIPRKYLQPTLASYHE